MLQSRLIPCLLLKESGLVKTIRFKNPNYIGDPINTLKLFNDKEVDELIIIDISVTKTKKQPQIDLIYQLASECFMPLCYGGGINSLSIAQKILNLGIEKIAINSFAIDNPDFITEVAKAFGNQSVIAVIDIKRDLFGQAKVFDYRKNKILKYKPYEYAQLMENKGAGEILLNFVDRDGTMNGYDIPTIKDITSAVSVPVIACGGAGQMQHFADVVKIGGVSAAAAGSYFVYKGKHKAVLINYPSQNEINQLFSNKE